MQGRMFFIYTIIMQLWAFAAAAQHGIQLQHLRCEMRNDPMGIDIEAPRLSWEITGSQRHIMQTAYQVIVADSPEQLAANEGGCWNSGKVSSGQSIHIPYAGKALQSRHVYYWKVKVWTNKGESNWSAPAQWSMGLLSPNAWKASWIGMDRAFPWDSAQSKFSRLSARYLRKTFDAKPAVKRATVYIAGPGLYELYLNGQRIGNQVLAPAATDFTKAVKYNTFDVTAALKKGGNTIGMVLGNGLFFTMRQAYKPHKIRTFGYPKLLLQLEIDYADGHRQTIVSDQSWKLTTDGPIRSNNLYDGEEYDATKEMPGWHTTGFDDSHWLQPELVQAPGGRLEAQLNEPMRIMDTVKPVRIFKARSKYILDMGQNMVGWLQIKAKGRRGEKVKLRFAETLQPDSTLFVANLRDARVTDEYTFKGEGLETWHPVFVYHGFRYVEVTATALPEAEGHVIYDAIPTTGSFHSSDSTLNQVYHNAYRGIRGNYKGMPLDCPQRNERMPWLGDRATGAHGESFLFGNASLYAKWLDDIADAQTPEGAIPDVAPAYWRYYSDNVTWPGVYILVANMLYEQFGDERSIERHYGSMKKWLAYMQGKYMKNYLLTKDKYGDWCVPPESLQLIHSQDPGRKTDGTLLATAYYYKLLTLMQRFAALLDNQADVKAFAALSDSIKTAFNKQFFHKDLARYSNNTVTANLLPLYFDMVPADARKAVFDSMAAAIQYRYNTHISTGVIGTQWLMRSLTRMGRPDLAYRMAANRDYPSWGYMVEQGATTIWELWNGNTANPGMNSHNHVMLLGDLLIWYYEDLAGIRTAADHPAFKQIVMQPALPQGLNEVDASFHSMYGLIGSKWKRENGRFCWKINIPANTTALIYMPAHNAAQVQEGGRAATLSAGVRFLRMEEGRAVFEVGSGEYAFESEAP